MPRRERSKEELNELLARYLADCENRDYDNIPEEFDDLLENNIEDVIGAVGKMANYINRSDDTITPKTRAKFYKSAPNFSRVGNAVMGNNTEKLKQVLAEGDSVNGNGAVTPLVFALLNGAVESCEILLQHKARADISWIPMQGKGAIKKMDLPYDDVLKLACTIPEIPRSEKIVSLLLKYKKYSQEHLKDAFFICVEHQNVPAAESLIQSKKLSPDFKDYRENPIISLMGTISDLQTSRGMIRMLVDNGANVNALDRRGNTAVSGISQMANDDDQSLRVILDTGRFTLIDQANISKATALHFAAVNGNHRCVTALLEHGANTELKDSLGNTAWVLANGVNAKKCQLALEKHLRIGFACFYPECETKKEDKPTFKRCARCKQITYCCATCQKAHWPTHKLTCKPPKMVWPTGN